MKGERNLQVLFVQKNNKIVVDNKQITTAINHEFSPDQKVNVRFIDYSSEKELKSISVTAEDIVILGFGRLYNPHFVKNDLPELIKHFKALTKRVGIATDFRYFASEQQYFDKDADNMALHQLSWDYRLPVLDIYSFCNAWYLSSSIEDRQANLSAISGFEDLKWFKAESSKRIFANYLASWIYRRFIRKSQPNFLYGASLYPEVWPDKVNEEDIANLHRVGLNTVRIGEFFWDRLEPEEGHYNMNYLRGLLTKLRNNHIKVILGIPSPTPPRWFTLHYPNARIVNQDGQVDEHGSRQHVCTNNFQFRKKVYELVIQIAHVVNEFDNIIAIQLDNEFKCHVDRCYCKTCRNLWSRWLREKYGTIGNLNQSWGTGIWSETYPSFSTVVMPTKTPFAHNTGLENAFSRFTADTLNDFASGMAQILLNDTRVLITHNSSMNFNLLNYELFNQLDIAGYDTYPRFKEYWNWPINLDLWRNVKDNNNFFLLETCASHVGYVGNYVPPYPPKYLPTEVFLGYAAGLNSILFWPYRAQAVGVEQTHGAIVTQAGTPDLGYRDVQQGSKVLNKLKPILQKTKIKHARVAIVYSDESKLYMNNESGGIYRWRPTFTEFYQAITRRGISVELIQANDNFEKFDCVLVPFVRCVDEQLLDKFKNFTADGGRLILGPLTSDRTVDGNWHKNINGLGRLGEWLGIDNVIQYLSSEDETAAQVIIDGQTDKFAGLTTLFSTDHPIKQVVTKAEVAGQRSITYQNRNVTYIGGMPKECMNSCFWDYLIDSIIRPIINDQIKNMSDGIYKYEREDSDNIYFFIANMTDHKGFIKLETDKMLDENDQRVNSNHYQVPAFSYKILKLRKKDV